MRSRVCVRMCVFVCKRARLPLLIILNYSISIQGDYFNSSKHDCYLYRLLNAVVAQLKNCHLKLISYCDWTKKYNSCIRQYQHTRQLQEKPLDAGITYFMVQSPSWEANWFAASQKIPRISRNPKVHYCTHKRPPPVPILSQPNPIHVPTFHLLEIHPNIIHPSTPRSPQWSLFLRFPHQDPIHPLSSSHTRHMPGLFHSSRFYHPHHIGWGVQII